MIYLISLASILLIQFASILLRVFPSMFIVDMNLVFFFVCVSLSVLDITGFIAKLNSMVFSAVK